jgi:flagellar basal-body rod protein FlgC
MVKGIHGFRSMQVSASGLMAQRRRMDTIAENIANVSTTQTAEGGPYRRKMVTLRTEDAPAALQPPGSQPSTLRLARTHDGHKGPMAAAARAYASTGVEVAEVSESAAPGRTIYDPTHPDAGADGYVEMPNVEIVSELVSLRSAARAYEANLAALRASQDAARDVLRIAE